MKGLHIFVLLITNIKSTIGIGPIEFPDVYLEEIVYSNHLKKIPLDEHVPKGHKYAYKPSWGFPQNCSQIVDKEDYNKLYILYLKCQQHYASLWGITKGLMLTETKEFCCYAIEVLECESKPIGICNPTFAMMNIRETRRVFHQYCNHIWEECKLEKSKTEVILMIVLSIITIGGMISGISYCCCRSAFCGKLNVVLDSIGLGYFTYTTIADLKESIRKCRKRGEFDIDDFIPG
ncbi:hypothetical protein SSS_04975 [Sarcoptes scabiei]|uniref:Uncharacterized protein n=1 Tax=Sarcoptes scabiei TaxID=52283 RepID=A0A834R9V8_SARSC|nr:hypothetical protein SSS_04975 [Sarcoptes scabiei]UXI21320.1 hypothetical protein NH340_JMT07263 [Sarcoptes scabiei]